MIVSLGVVLLDNKEEEEDSGSGLKGLSLLCLSTGLCTGVLFTSVGAAAAGLAAIAARVVVLGAKRG